MDLHNEVPVEISHLLEGNISQDASVVNDNVHSAEVVDCCLHNLVSELHRVVVGYCSSSQLLNFLNNDVCSV